MNQKLRIKENENASLARLAEDNKSKQASQVETGKINKLIILFILFS